MIRRLYPILFILVLCGLCAAVVTAARSAWRSDYELNLQFDRTAAILTALGLAEPGQLTPDRARDLFHRHVTVGGSERMPVYEARSDGEVSAYAFEVIGAGHWGEMRGVVGLEPDKTTIRSVRIYRQEETPGVGAKVAGDEYLARFAGKVIRDASGEPGLTLIRQGSADAPDEIDAMTGATKTSKALVGVINQAIQEFLAGRRLVEMTIEYPPASAGLAADIPPGSSAEPPTRIPPPTLLVPPGTENVALGRPVTASDAEPILGTLEMVTDGDRLPGAGHYVELGPFLSWVQVDLGDRYDIHAVAIWRNYAQPGVYKDMVVQVSDDPAFETGVTTVFNNDRDNSAGFGEGTDREYVETFQGKVIEVRQTAGRYVRVTADGTYMNPMSHYVEVEVYASPAGNE